MMNALGWVASFAALSICAGMFWFLIRTVVLLRIPRISGFFGDGPKYVHDEFTDAHYMKCLSPFRKRK